MKLTCERAKFLSVFQPAASVAPTRSPKPVLQNVKLEARPDKSALLATDLELSVRVEVPGLEVEVPGDALLPIGRVGGILRESSDEKLSFECDGRRLTVRGTTSQFNLPIENPEDYPVVPTFHWSKYHEMPSRLFCEAIRRTIFATDAENVRYALGGVLLELGENEFIAVATDGRRLTRQQGPATAVNGHSTLETTTVVPTRALQLLERVLSTIDDNVRISAQENTMAVSCGQFVISTRLVEGRFPKWREVFPRGEDMKKIDIPVGAFYGAIKQAAVVMDPERPRMEFTFGEGKVVIVGQGAEFGESRVEVPIAYDQEPLSVIFDPRFLIEFFRVLDADVVCTVEIGDPEKAVLFTTNDGYAYIVMPLSRERGGW